ncbi:GntR family transcriptional regulator [Falsiroseomonas bella]|uniref:GntR family transcriptional regulator n=1 Tax=Falsiroseomonas bella TaxID=2184016 RepID=A0A317F8Q1_9PROT|nr:GntR family transcriptional regulator [Falsiroseomonas bella]PWS35145.1 GntR family transcriptional regulator [Falsiroseomonas bella]
MNLARRPLYAQTEEILTQRIAEGVWAPGALIPPEPELAAELGVSPGTVRKALTALERRRLIERRQGRGTYVAAQTSERALFHFFRIHDLADRKHEPTSLVLDFRTGPATAEQAAALDLAEGAPVHRVERIRALAAQPVILERILLPAERFPRFALPLLQEMEDELYVLYQRDHGVTIGRAEERLGAVAADEAQAAKMRLWPGAPVLEIQRIAFDLADRPVERRVTWVDTRMHRYLARLD